MPRSTICGTFLPNGTLITGASNGKLYFWDVQRGNCLKAIDAHKGEVRALVCRGNSQNCVVSSGGADGVVKQWRATSNKMTCYASSNIAEAYRSFQRSLAASEKSSNIFPSRGASHAATFAQDNRSGKALKSRHAIMSLSWDGDELCAVTKRGDIWEVSKTKSHNRISNGRKATSTPVQIVHSHFAPLYGCAPHPKTSSWFVTSGEDKQLIIWDADAHSQVCAAPLPTLGRSCAFDPSGAQVAVGCANGSVLIYELKVGVNRKVPTLSLCTKFRDCVEFIDDLKYSPDGKLLAVGSHDNFIDIYAVRGKVPYRRISRCKGHTSYITHLDWSKDSKVLQSNCGAYEIIYWDARRGKPIMSSRDSVEADTKWSTWTCVLGFPVMGIWPEYTDGTDVNAVHLSENRDFLVTGDDFGKVKIFNAPCVVHHAPARTHGGHSSHVMNVRWLLGDRKVISVGGWDEAVMLWRVVGAGNGSGKLQTSAWKPMTGWKGC